MFVEWLNHTLRWFRNKMRMNDSYFVRKIHAESIERSGVMGRPQVKWINRVDLYYREILLDWVLRMIEESA